MAKMMMKERMFTPLFPWCFVQVLPRVQKVGRIFLPGEKNKVTHEGIVLATWRRAPAKFYNVNSKRWEKPESLTPSVSVGQHVLFPHWAGMPVTGYSEEEYRVVKDLNWAKDNEGGIFGIVDYEDKEAAWETALYETILGSLYGDEAGAVEVLNALKERFIVIDKTVGSVTLSGV
jgi:co-chaperonin GroES (HSP10)